jgi:hypothetical protein
MQKSVFLTLAGSAALLFAGCDSATTTKSDSDKPAATTPDASGTPEAKTSEGETSTDLGTPATPPEGGSAVKPGAELAPAAGTDAK